MKFQLYSLLVCVGYFVVFLHGAPLLPNDQVEALREIAQTLGKRDWNFGVDPCSGESSWMPRNQFKGAENAVTCNCSYVNNTVCHVTSIILKAQSLPGVLPPELVKLPYLLIIDLTRNYLNGSIPKEWGSMQLLTIELSGNRLSGRIPPELANITTLKNFTLEFNQLSGVLPPELGNWTSIERILLSSNNFSGPLPETLAKLTTLKDFRINDNHFSGKIPNFIQNWVNLEKIAMHASGLEGPIPLGVSLLTKVTDMRISDLTGINTVFPPISNMTQMRTLVLRSCNIIGEIPAYLGDMANLKTLDLSFNKLTGQIPSSLERLEDAKYVYFTGNALTGTVPQIITRKIDNIDLSYNNFTLGSSIGPDCQQQNANLFGSSSTRNNSNGVVPCLRSLRCPKIKYYSFHINCGGREATIGGSTTYEDDIDSAGASKFFLSRYNWAFSSTGHFMDDGKEPDDYIAANTSRLSMRDYQLYTNARLSPLSLTYFGVCLLNGNYTVNLHFAEIFFTNDRNYSSLGKRLFDIYIQGKLVWKDFNIEDEAGGAGREVIKNFTAVVTGTTLEIHFYWAGKGTVGIPDRGTYGPLVSAISVEPNFKPPLEHKKKVSPAIVIGVVLSVLVVIASFLGVLWWNGCFRRKHGISEDLKGLDLQTGSFTLRQIKAATNNFDAANKIGEGGFGPVYKGLLLDGTIIAVKQLSSKSRQGNREFVNEIGMISALQHPHLVKLYGCCIEGNQLLLVYEYMENNSLARALFESQMELDWPTRHKICVGIARALAFLHEESRLKIVHRDIKATNVLLDKDLNAKVSDFGLAKLDEEEHTHMSTRIAGTYGYMAPEYAMRGHLTDKADVYSFGIVALEIVSGRSNMIFAAKEECQHLLDWAQALQQEGTLMELVDPRLGSNYVEEEVRMMIDLGLECTNTSPQLRPLMSFVVSMLEGKTPGLKFVPNSSTSSDKATRDQYQHVLDESTSDVQTQSMSMGAPWTGSSVSETDLYPNNPDTEYWKKREQISP